MNAYDSIERGAADECEPLRGRRRRTFTLTHLLVACVGVCVCAIAATKAVSTHRGLANFGGPGTEATAAADKAAAEATAVAEAEAKAALEAKAAAEKAAADAQAAAEKAAADAKAATDKAVAETKAATEKATNEIDKAVGAISNWFG